MSERQEGRLERHEPNETRGPAASGTSGPLRGVDRRLLALQGAAGNRAVASVLQRQVRTRGHSGARARAAGFTTGVRTLASAALRPGQMVTDVLAAIRALDPADCGRFWTEPPLRGHLERAIPDRNSLDLALLLIRWGDERAIPPRHPDAPECILEW